MYKDSFSLHVSVYSYTSVSFSLVMLPKTSNISVNSAPNGEDN